MVAISSKTINYDGSDAFNGIINYFRNITKTKDPYQKGLIDIFVSANESLKENVFVDESTSRSGYWYNYAIGSWIAIDFGLNKVSLSHYTIKAWGHDFCPEWIVEASNDKDNWETIHDGRLSSMPEDVLTNRTFKTDKKVAKRYIRFRSTVNRYAKDNAFVIHRLEFFGKFHSFLERSERGLYYCRTHSRITINSAIILMLNFS